MKRTSKNFRLPPATIKRLDWLKTRYSSETATLILAIDRLYETERSKMPADSITIVWTEETLWGSADPNEYNQAQSEQNYTQRIINNVHADYPEAEISVTRGAVEQVSFNGQTDTDAAENVRLLVETAWSYADWLVA